MSNNEFSFQEILHSIEEKLLNGGAITRKEAATLADVDDSHLMALLALADRIRIRFKGNAFDSCSLINARAGKCGEDCAFCAQSAKHSAESETYPLVSTDKILEAALQAKRFGASRFCAVTSGGALSEREFHQLTQSLKIVGEAVDIALDASLGFLDDKRVNVLKSVGVTRYNHNLETSRERYPKICTTHTFEQRVETVKKVKQNNVSACCGGIIGMGESMSQRLDLAFELAEIGVDCVPINILNPRPGTPLESEVPPPPLEILKTLALFRLALPKATIKVAGGREINLRDFQATALRSGANGMIIGGYLTTSGRSIEDDLRMVEEAGYVMS